MDLCSCPEINTASRTECARRRRSCGGPFPPAAVSAALPAQQRGEARPRRRAQGRGAGKPAVAGAVNGGDDFGAHWRAGGAGLPPEPADGSVRQKHRA